MFKIKAFSPVTLQVVRNGKFVTETLVAGGTTFTEFVTPQIEQCRKNKVLFVKAASQKELDELKKATAVKAVKISNADAVQAKIDRRAKANVASVARSQATPSGSVTPEASTKAKNTKSTTTDKENLIGKEESK